MTVVKILLAWTGTLKIIYLEKVKMIIYLEKGKVIIYLEKVKVIIYLEKVKVILYLEKVKVELAPFEHPFDMLLNIIFNIFAHRMS